MAPKDLKGEIDFNNISFHYGNREDVISNLNFSIKKGEKIGIVGESGSSGKTTLVKLLFKYYLPQKGTVSIDGYDIRDLDTGIIRDRIGYVPQDIVLFSGSVRDNIAYGNQGVPIRSLLIKGNGINGSGRVNILFKKPMKNTILNIDDIRESRVLLDQKPPWLINFFIYFLLFMAAVAFLFSWFGKIEIVVKTHGTIRPFNTISRIRSVREGEIESLCYESGQSIKQGDPLLRVNCQNQLLELKRIQDRMDELKEKSKDLQILKKSLEKDKNEFPRTNREFYERYALYSCKKRKLELARDVAQAKYNTQESMSQFVARSILEDLEYKLRMTELELQIFIGSSFLEVIDEYDSTKREMRSLASRKEELEEDVSLSTIYAPISGIVNRLTELNDGDYLFSGMNLLDIVPVNYGKGKVEISISNQDIAGIKVGDAVSYRLPALPKEKYGVLKGNIISIPVDLKNSSDGLFIVEGSFDNMEDFPELKNGMFVDVRITVRMRQILFHLLDKLGFASDKI